MYFLIFIISEGFENHAIFVLDCAVLEMWMSMIRSDQKLFMNI
jgi:hypothetical protein